MTKAYLLSLPSLTILDQCHDYDNQIKLGNYDNVLIMKKRRRNFAARNDKNLSQALK